MPNSEVLLVEDNDINRDMLTRRLSRAGLTVITAQDGETALQTMRTAQPGVVLMDMTLPVLDGWEATQQAKTDPTIANIPIIALTAHAMAADRERAMSVGMQTSIANVRVERQHLRLPLAAAPLGRRGRHAGRGLAERG